MIVAATQRTRRIAVQTPLGDDALLLVRFTGSEAISRPFELSLQMLSAMEEIAASDIVGHNVTIRVERPDDEEPRYFNGYVSRFTHAGKNERGHEYHATVVPWLWFLTQTADCRIFQELSAVEIIEMVFADLGFSDYQLRLAEQYPKREYCVQYRESDFDFVSRLLEEEGIFYYFRHENGKHTLVLADRATAYPTLTDAQVQYALPNGSTDMYDQIKVWEHGYAFRSGRFANTDYNFKKPRLSLMCRERSRVELPNNSAYEIYDYPGLYHDKNRGENIVRVRMEELEASHETVKGESTYRSFAPGGQFTVARHVVTEEVGKAFAIIAVEHQVSVDGTYITGTAQGDEEYTNRFVAIPADVVYRPPRLTRRPIVEGPQTAVVVGLRGEEIWPDEFGRVKVQFHWDREGQNTERSSCWIRVSQTHAGRGFGGIDLPRIGEEVVVDFLEGDPDRPIITGRVYNDANMPPFALPAQKTRSGMKSNTHKGKGNNEISMDDTAGAEQLRTHAQFNMDTTVGNNQTLVVGVDRTTDIGNNETLTVGNNSAESIGVNKEVKVGTDMNTQVGAKYVLNAGTSITLRTGAAQIHMNKSGLITITGTIITIAGSANASMVAPLTEIIGGIMLTTIGGINTVQGGVTSVGAASLCSVSSSGKLDAVGGQTNVKGAPIKLN
jgi:type VI secretion system secreted protein VgrG